MYLIDFGGGTNPPNIVAPHSVRRESLSPLPRRKLIGDVTASHGNLNIRTIYVSPVHTCYLRAAYCQAES